MRALIKLLIITVLLAILVGPFAVVLLAFDDAPAVTTDAPLKVEDVERLKALLKQNDPRRLRAGESRKLALSERDINLGIEYALSRLFFAGDTRARTDLGDGRGHIELSMPLPENPLGRYLNVRAEVVPAERGVELHALRIGRVPVPQWLARKAQAYLDEHLQDIEGYREAVDLLQAISAVQFSEDRVALTLQWQGDLAARIEQRGRELVLPAEERERLLVYTERLAGVSEDQVGESASLTQVLKPMLAHAAERTRAGNDAAVENRAALLALALFVAARGDDMERLLGAEQAARLPRVRPLTLSLQNREDLAQHFLVSAALTGAANSAIAEVIGVFKEVQDSRGGSGFSFADLAADRAGVRFAEAAAANPRALQDKVAGLTGETDYMPTVDQLPEAMQEPAFIRRFQDRDSEAYALVSAEIERRLDACALFR